MVSKREIEGYQPTDNGNFNHPPSGSKTLNFEVVTEFESKIAKFFGSSYAVAVDSCTHGVELCLRHTSSMYIDCPKQTYLSIPFLASKLNIKLNWKDESWQDYYHLTKDVIDAAVLWRKDSYIPSTFMCVSFQYQKHLSLGRGGVILTDNKEAAEQLKKASYDGRLPGVPWREQDIDTVGFHYYATPELCKLGLDKLDEAIVTKPRQWVLSDWPDLTKMKVFQDSLVQTLPRNKAKVERNT